MPPLYCAVGYTMEPKLFIKINLQWAAIQSQTNDTVFNDETITQYLEVVNAILHKMCKM